MNRLSIITYAVAALMLASATTVSNAQSGAAAQAASTVAETKASTRDFCNFVPTTQTILQILAIGVPWLQTAQFIAAAICNAIPAQGPDAKRAFIANPPTVYGVPVKGSYVARPAAR